VDLEHDGPELAASVEHPEHGERIEDVTELARVGEHEHAVGGVEDDASGVEPAGQVPADASAEPASVQVIGRVEPGEPAHGARENGKVVQVDQPLTVGVVEPVASRRAARVGDPPDDQGQDWK